LRRYVRARGTADPQQACATNDWPVDINNDGKAGLTDILAYIPVFGSVAPTPLYNARFDLNTDGKAGLTFIPFFNLTSTP
jgi:hypothetical protein